MAYTVENLLDIEDFFSVCHHEHHITPANLFSILMECEYLAGCIPDQGISPKYQ